MSNEDDNGLATLEQQAEFLGLKGPLLPLLPPKSLTRKLQRERLPRRSREAPFGARHPSWTVDRFIVPAAFPRSVKGSTTDPASSPSEKASCATSASTSLSSSSKAPPGRIDADRACKELLDVQLEGLRNPTNPIDTKELASQEQLYTVVNRYRSSTTHGAVLRRSKEPILTLVLGHANGFHKETFEPMLSDLLEQFDSKTRPIGEIWSIDTFNQGDSALLNEDVLGKACEPKWPNGFLPHSRTMLNNSSDLPTVNWADHGRDILNFIISYLPDPFSPDPITDELPYIVAVADGMRELDARPLFPGLSVLSKRVFRDRLIVGIGHSLSGAGMIYAASAQPSLFSSLILLDPAIPPPSWERQVMFKSKGAFIRKDRWPSKEAALVSLKKKPFYQTFDSRSMQAYVEYGMTTILGSEEARLKMRPQDEALVFGDLCTTVSRRASGRLAMLPTILPVRFICADLDCSVLTEEALQDTLRLIPHATIVRVKKAFHTLVQEKPKETAAEVAKHLQAFYGDLKFVKL
ncbi:BZ3500_MvSof-1268-A1-R1_Chr7-1g09158 [Microbotryum saponariae]|uniref:BZ3500_MvSof-1268-A1-R1_Chr7-1g09158 protein n=1 Tax=Microbotryum saponariae TaxID=289078 RepID=A0A2X0MZX9_9BASI|nr:BZ3501_MvSof-1269-A2-R1_Chr7-1g08863 [Microbotryum saponariae]SDA02904.1 BZ3500_MvSof-1268-A1-R1_Chr7-1g09158 [Microbotryum saponariae]